MSYLSLEKRIALSETRPDMLAACQDWDCKALNAVIKSLKKQAAELRGLAYDLTDKASILEDEVCRRAEHMETRIQSTTDDDL